LWSANIHYPWAALEPPLTGLGSADLAPPILRGITFANPGGQVAVASRLLDRPCVTIPVHGRADRIYLLLLPLLDNHDVFAPVGRIAVTCSDGTLFARTLHFPGDLDWWGPKRIIGGFATVGHGWSSNPAWEAHSAVMNVVAIDLGGMRGVDSVTVETIGRYPALGVVGVTAMGCISPDGYSRLSPAARRIADRVPRPIFSFDRPALDGWEIRGTAWGIGDTVGDTWGRRGTSRYFVDSRAHGEEAMGTILSPQFRVTGSRLQFLANGWGARNYFALVDAATGAELRRAPAPLKTGAFEPVEWDVTDLRGRMVRFEGVDAESGSGYAWIAFDDITQ
jgi:hypothetical protein